MSGHGSKKVEIYFVNLDPTLGSEIKKTRPCLVISPDEINKTLNTVIVAPLTSTIRNYPTRINCIVAGQNAQIALGQLRAIDKLRLNKKVELLDLKTKKLVLDVIAEMFS
jgi:mRNA interferase MazF